MVSSDWKLRLERFFYDQAAKVDGVPTLLDHCRVSGKDPRLSARPDLHRDLIASIENALNLDSTSNVLEVGCASGYIACGLAPRVAQYTGIDMSSLPLAVAGRMNMANARFFKADGEALSFQDESFDAVIANDVLQNIPSFDEAMPLVREMLRVVKRGGRVMIGSVADKSKAAQYQVRVHEYSKWLTAEYGPPPVAGPGKLTSAASEAVSAAPDVPGEAIFYYYDYDNFFDLGASLGADVRMEDVHPLNPYRGYRHNFILTKR